MTYVLVSVIELQWKFFITVCLLTIIRIVTTRIVAWIVLIVTTAQQMEKKESFGINTVTTVQLDSDATHSIILFTVFIEIAPIDSWLKNSLKEGQTWAKAGIRSPKKAELTGTKMQSKYQRPKNRQGRQQEISPRVAAGKSLMNEVEQSGSAGKAQWVYIHWFDWKGITAGVTGECKKRVNKVEGKLWTGVRLENGARLCNEGQKLI